MFIIIAQWWKYVRQHLENCVMFKIKTFWCYGMSDVTIDSINFIILSDSNNAPILYTLHEEVDLNWSLKCSKFPYENAYPF